MLYVCWYQQYTKYNKDSFITLWKYYFHVVDIFMIYLSVSRETLGFFFFLSDSPVYFFFSAADYWIFGWEVSWACTASKRLIWKSSGKDVKIHWEWVFHNFYTIYVLKKYDTEVKSQFIYRLVLIIISLTCWKKKKYKALTSVWYIGFCLIIF